jgi:hypothetical protein
MEIRQITLKERVFFRKRDILWICARDMKGLALSDPSVGKAEAIAEPGIARPESASSNKTGA